ncbi:hypothetical protein LR48_Vigan03g107500 [Vigna angularis]|uniref:Uncharacterized protein n=1 Tax=Phaseolus angularis TaxID=3914 RepID=A0A0L9U4E1_PHAAN|nr:hypothetical protein LR48_Vigan03g107500 [Vigna angularis]
MWGWGCPKIDCMHIAVVVPHVPIFGEATYDGVDGHGERIEVDVGEGDKIEVDVGEGQRIEVDAGEVDIIQDDVGEDERIQVHVGEVDKMEVHVGEGDRIQIDVGEGERIEVDEGHDVEGKRIEDDESHDDRTQANDVEETIEVHETHHQSTEANDVEETIVVDEAHDERTEVNDLESETMEVDEAHDERIVVNDGEGNRTEVEELEDIEVEVREWSTSDDNGEVNSMDGLVDINIQCDLRESDNYGNVEVAGSGLPESDLEEDDISDTTNTFVNSPIIAPSEVVASNIFTSNLIPRATPKLFASILIGFRSPQHRLLSAMANQLCVLPVPTSISTRADGAELLSTVAATAR